MGTTMTGNALNQWIEEEEALKLRLAEAKRNGEGMAYVTSEMVKDHSGLAIMQGILCGRYTAPSIGQTLGFLLVSVADGEVIFQGTPSPAVLNPMGGVHGGWYATLLDSAMACAVHTKIPKGRLYTTAELSVNLVRGIGQTPKLRAVGRVIHVGRQMATAEGKLIDADGKLYAHGTTTCLIFDPK